MYHVTYGIGRGIKESMKCACMAHWAEILRLLIYDVLRPKRLLSKSSRLFRSANFVSMVGVIYHGTLPLRIVCFLAITFKRVLIYMVSLFLYLFIYLN